ncbi:hypothetical protein L596_015599 [Steinernema carpocapsae]|uniref:LIM zinc-binding domain-containing protein n=1 Tax=Steinernema carpocapsae TaxID=34508 RepID=A0A4U5NFH3_STECR|nr:hypothetical protein L596_015599 [Steinernema carpocapsae]TKR81778.1 hypothetical protein L596_015599 [Steinernema carpocapsae]
MVQGIVHTPTTVLSLDASSRCLTSDSSASPASSSVASSAFNNGAINVGRRLTRGRDGLRCASCRIPVTDAEADDGQVIYSLRRLWHRSHFSCVRCNVPIGNDLREFRECPGARDRPMCLDCFMETTHPKCFGCTKPLMETFVRIGKNRWHRTCLLCERCKNPLHCDQYVMHDGKIYDIDCFYAKKLEPWAAALTSGSESDSSSTLSSSDASTVSTAATKLDGQPVKAVTPPARKPDGSDSLRERAQSPRARSPRSSSGTSISMDSTQIMTGGPEKVSILDLPKMK